MTWTPTLTRRVEEGRLSEVRLGHPLVDEYLGFVGARLRPNSWLAAGYDLKVFSSVVEKEPVDVSVHDVFAFLAEQRAPRRGDRCSAWRTASGACRHGRCVGACRASRGCSTTCRPEGWSSTTRCRVDRWPAIGGINADVGRR
jgi:hypothetical protein